MLTRSRFQARLRSQTGSEADLQLICRQQQIILQVCCASDQNLGPDWRRTAPVLLHQNQADPLRRPEPPKFSHLFWRGCPEWLLVLIRSGSGSSLEVKMLSSLEGTSLTSDLHLYRCVCVGGGDPNRTKQVRFCLNCVPN